MQTPSMTDVHTPGPMRNMSIRSGNAMGCKGKKKKKIKMAESLILLGEYIMAYGFRERDYSYAGRTEKGRRQAAFMNALEAHSKKSYQRKYGNRGTLVGGLMGAGTGAMTGGGDLRTRAIRGAAGGAIGAVGGRLVGKMYGGAKRRQIRERAAAALGDHPARIFPVTTGRI